MVAKAWCSVVDNTIEQSECLSQPLLPLVRWLLVLDVRLSAPASSVAHQASAREGRSDSAALVTTPDLGDLRLNSHGRMTCGSLSGCTAVYRQLLAAKPMYLFLNNCLGFEVTTNDACAEASWAPGDGERVGEIDCSSHRTAAPPDREWKINSLI